MVIANAQHRLTIDEQSAAGDRFQINCIVANHGAKLSLQKHFHLAEHWVVVNGTAIVTRNDEEILLRENESVFVPLGCMHRTEAAKAANLTSIISSFSHNIWMESQC